MKNTTIWIVVLLFLLLVVFGPMIAFPRLQENLTEEINTLSSYDQLPAKYIEWQGRNAYVYVWKGTDQEMAQEALEDIRTLTGVREAELIYSDGIEYSEAAAPEPSTIEEATSQMETTTIAVERTSSPEETTTASKEEEVAQVEEAVAEVVSFSTLEFESGTADLTEASGQAIKAIAGVMAAYPEVKLNVIGHTDAQGDADANQVLSLNRAESVVEALVSEGVDESRLMAEGKGESQPIADNTTPEGRKQNRRVEFIGLND